MNTSISEESTEKGTYYDTTDDVSLESIATGVETYAMLTSIGFILLLQLGHLMFEYGAVRKKNSETVLIKSLVVFFTAILATYSFGYGFAYGETYVIGFEEYFTPFVRDSNEEGREAKWCLLAVTMSVAA